MTDESRNVIDIHKHNEEKKISDLYDKYDGLALEETPEIIEYSQRGMNILEDVMYFLQHRELQIQFEQDLIIYLKNFAISHLKQG